MFLVLCEHVILFRCSLLRANQINCSAFFVKIPTVCNLFNFCLWPIILNGTHTFGYRKIDNIFASLLNAPSCFFFVFFLRFRIYFVYVLIEGPRAFLSKGITSSTTNKNIVLIIYNYLRWRQVAVVRVRRVIIIIIRSVAFTGRRRPPYTQMPRGKHTKLVLVGPIDRGRYFIIIIVNSPERSKLNVTG